MLLLLSEITHVSLTMFLPGISFSALSLQCPPQEKLLEITCTLTLIPLFLSLSETFFHHSYSAMLQTKPLSSHSKSSFATLLFPQITYHLIAYHRYFLFIFLYWFPQPLGWKLHVARFSLFYFLTFVASHL